MGTADQRTVEIGGRIVGDGAPVYLVAEVGSNHDGDLATARELVKRAAAAAVDAVKFQLFRAASVYPPNCGVVDTPIGPVDLFEVFTESELPLEWLEELRLLADDEGVAFLCTAFDEETMGEVAALGLPALKIASPELNHLPLLRSAARFRRPLVCSTGLCTLADVDEAVATIRQESSTAEIVLLQCVTAYPAPVEDSNLGVIDTLARAFGVPVGLSDHTTDPEETPAVAAAAGACLIEKHLTLDRTRSGPDHPFAIEPDELSALVRTVRALGDLEPDERLLLVRRRYGEAAVERRLGTGRKEIQPSERPLYPGDKRSIHAIRQITEGEPLGPENLRILRSERNLSPGLHPRCWDAVRGAIASRPIALGEGLAWSHLVRYASSG